jgi:hypothetical protein
MISMFRIQEQLVPHNNLGNLKRCVFFENISNHDPRAGDLFAPPEGTFRHYRPGTNNLSSRSILKFGPIRPDALIIWLFMYWLNFEFNCLGQCTSLCAWIIHLLVTNTATVTNITCCIHSTSANSVTRRGTTCTCFVTVIIPEPPLVVQCIGKYAVHWKLGRLYLWFSISWKVPIRKMLARHSETSI